MSMIKQTNFLEENVNSQPLGDTLFNPELRDKLLIEDSISNPLELYKQPIFPTLTTILPQFHFPIPNVFLHKQKVEDEKRMIMTPLLQNLKNLLKIEQGIITQQNERVLGGRGNKEPLQRHTIALDSTLLPKNFLPENLILKAKLCGLKKNQSIVEIENLTQNNLIKINNDWKCDFDNLVIQHASHNNGQKLFIRFSLEYKDQVLYRVDTACFETITKRGIEKKRKKNEIGDLIPIIESFDPPFCPIKQTNLVKIYGKQFPDISSAHILVKFGNILCTEVVCIKKDMIICETPLIPESKDLKVSISFDRGVTFTNESENSFSFIEKNTEGIDKFLKYILGDTTFKKQKTE